jgi:hypothetical protein
MPRKSLRRWAIELVQNKVDNLLFDYNMREAMDEDDSSADEELINEMESLHKMKNNRYLFRPTRYRSERQKFDLEDALSPNSVNFNEEEFLFLFRITRESFFLFLEEMEPRDAFAIKSNSCHQRPIAFQLLVFLYGIGKEGSGGGCLDVACFFGIGKGSVKNYVCRTVKALLEIEEEVVCLANCLTKNGYEETSKCLRFSALRWDN